MKRVPVPFARPLLFACLGLLLASCDWPWKDDDDARVIRLSGTVEAREVDLAFQVPGRITVLHVDEGQTVAAGDVVAELDAYDFELALQRARAEAEAAQATLAALQAGTREQEIRAAEATLAKAQAELKFAQAEVRRIGDLVGRRLASQESLEQAQRQLDVAQSNTEEARQRLDLLREGPRKEDIARAEAELAARLAAVRVAEQQLAYTQLRTPVAGVVSVRLAERGEVVAAGQPVLRVAKLGEPWVRAYLEEPDLARVRLGQAAEVRVDGLPDRTFPGRLSFISPEAEFTPKTVQTRELRTDLVYRVKVDLENPDGLLKIGMPADVYLEAAAP